MADIISSAKPARTDEEEITCFVNNIGMGLQFAAIGALLLEKARGMEIGTKLTPEWFSETVHP